MALLTVKETAAKLRRSERFVLDELRQKHLRGAKFGGAWSVDPDDLETYIQARMNMTRVRRSMDSRGSGAITALVLLAIFAAVIGACLYMAASADNQTLLEQVENAGQSIGNAFGGAW